jgi:formate dehydrogenase
MHGSEALANDLERTVSAGVRVQRVPCIGRCAQAPAVVVGQRPLEHATTEAVQAAVDMAQTQAPVLLAPTVLQAVAGGAYAQLLRCLRGELDREAVLATVEAAGLRGLGGAGFPTARKWRTVAAQPGPRLMAINADEGEPGLGDAPALKVRAIDRWENEGGEIPLAGSPSGALLAKSSRAPGNTP